MNNNYYKDNDTQIEELWDELEDVTFMEDENNDLVLVSDWHIWKARTSRDTIWEWLNYNHSMGILWLQDEYDDWKLKNNK